MFSENNRISERQAFRLLTYDLLGLSTLLVPTALAGLAGRDGIFSIAIGVAAGILYLRLLCALGRDCAVPFPVYTEQKLGKACGKLMQSGFFLYLLVLAGYTAYLFADVVLKSLLREASFYLVLAVALALVLYGLWGGLEGRARIYEILFWILLIPLFVMLFFALDEIKTDYWSPVFTAGAGNVFAGGYYVFSCLAVIFLVLFLGNYMDKRERLFAAGKRAILLTGGVHAVLYLILTGVFGDRALADMKYPAVTLMSTVRISGEFLRRTDAFMFAVWFFTLYALLASCVFYCGILLMQLLDGRQKLYSEKKREKMAYVAAVALTGALACTFYRSRAWMEICEWALWHIGTPFVVLAPLLLFWEKRVERYRFRRAGRTALMVLAVCLLSGTLCGCAAAELEDRNFPLELALTDGSDLTREFLDAGNDGNRLVDYSHLKVLILNESFVQDEELMGEFLQLLEQKSEIPQSTYLVVAKDADAIAGMEKKLGQPVGTYLEQTFENVSQVKKQAYPTLGMLFQEYENKSETLFLPYVKEDGENLDIAGYYVWQRGRAHGGIDHGTAMLSFFTQGQMDEYPLTLESGAAVSLSGAHTKLAFSEENGRKTVTATVRCSGEWISEEFSDKGEQEMTRQAQAYMNQVAEQALMERQVDVTNSFRQLGAKRDWYFYYRDKEKVYEQDIRVEYELIIDWVNL